MIALVDYGAGNVRSVHKALEAVGADVKVTRRASDLRDAERVVLPGVGAFGDCMAGLQRGGLATAIHGAVEAGKPLLGICVGLQVLFEEGEEIGHHPGLGLLPGRVVRFSQDRVALGLKIPHTGWNQLRIVAQSPLLHGLPPGAWVYFNHAYYGQARLEDTLAFTDYGGTFSSVVGRYPIYGIQWHPEKSQGAGLLVLRNFVEGVK